MLGFLKSKTPPPVVTQPVKRPPVLEGWSESDLVSVYNSSPVRHLKKGDPLFRDLEFTDSFFVLLDGAFQIVVKWEGHMGRPAVIHRGDCVPPLPKSPGLLYCSEAVEQCTVIELTPTVMNHLPAATQLCVYKVAIKATSRVNAYIRAVNGEVSAKNARLVSYIGARDSQRRAPSQSERVGNFLSSVPRLPAYGMDLMLKLLDDTSSVQEVAEAIKKDPAIAALVLRVVNSAQYAFSKKIETFYHACIILGFNNLYSLIMREAVEATLPANEETHKIHAHACLISFLAYELCACAKDVPAQTIMTLGLLHDLGKGVQVVMKHANWTIHEYVDTFDSARLGGNLLRKWELPERLCQMVEAQEQPEFTPPDLMPAELRREVGILHVAHVLESLIMGETPISTIYTKDYLAAIGIGGTPEAFLKERIIPALTRNLRRLPQGVQTMVQSSL